MAGRGFPTRRQSEGALRKTRFGGIRSSKGRREDQQICSVPLWQRQEVQEVLPGHGSFVNSRSYPRKAANYLLTSDTFNLSAFPAPRSADFAWLSRYSLASAIRPSNPFGLKTPSPPS